MTPLEIITLTIIGCSAFYIPIFRRTLKRERAVVEAQSMQLILERRQFFNAIQEKAGANAFLPCRTCSVCNRVVHRYRSIEAGVICKECDLDSKGTR